MQIVESCHPWVRRAFKAFEKHKRLAEALLGPDDLDDFLRALRGREPKLHLTVDDDMEPHARIAATKDRLAFVRVHDA